MHFCRQTDLFSLCTGGGEGGQDTHAGGAQGEPAVFQEPDRNDCAGLDDVKELQRLLADNERRSGTHRILVQPANLRLMTDPGFDLIQIEKYAKKEGAYNSSSYKKLCKQAEKEAVLRAAAKANEKSDDEE